MKVAAFVACGLLLGVAEARADLVFFTTGRFMKVQAVREEGATAVLTLPDGGEVTCDRQLIAEIRPDELPPESPVPPAVAPVAQVAPAASSPAVLAPVSAVYAGMIARSASTHGVDPRLVRAVIQVESQFQSRARSPKGAMGLMQLMPDTARRYGVRQPLDPAANIDAGTRHLRWLLDRFPLDRALALAAYNAGEAAVERYRGIPPYRETRDYVGRILQLLAAPADIR
jgi:hypothetical protein